jgi:uncharacterized protein (DUF4213/DUF364 family)
MDASLGSLPNEFEIDGTLDNILVQTKKRAYILVINPMASRISHAFFNEDMVVLDGGVIIKIERLISPARRKFI